jgi:hypothetical protein
VTCTERVYVVLLVDGLFLIFNVDTRNESPFCWHAYTFDIFLLPLTHKSLLFIRVKKETIQSQSKDDDHHQVCVYVMHFSMNNDWIKNAIITGSTASNSVSYWTTETTKFSDHTAYLPDLANNVITNDVMNGEIFYKKDFYHWTIGTHFMGIRWECDDFSYNIADTSHQIWFKQKSTASSSSP